MLLRTTTLTLLLPVGLLATVVLHAQPPPSYSFKTLTFREGLSHSYVTDIKQDTLGYVWLATRNGLNRFDGSQVIVFKHRQGDSTSLPNNFIRKIFLDSKQRMWLITSSGVCQYQAATDDFQTYPFSATGKHESDRPLDITERPDGQILVLSRPNTLSAFSEEEQRFEKLLDIHSEVEVQTLATYRDRIFVGALRWLLEISTSNGAVISSHELHDEALPLAAGITQLTTVGNQLWMAGPMINLHRFDPGEGVLERIDELPYITSFASLTKEVFFVGSHQGLFLYDTRTSEAFPLESVDHTASLSDIVGVLVDRDGNLWAASQEEGAIYTTGPRVFGDLRDLSASLTPYRKEVSSLQLVDQELWLGLTSGQIAAIDLGNAQHRWVGDSTAGLPPGGRSVFSIWKDDEQRVWVGSYEGGLRQYDASQDWFVQRSQVGDTTQIRSNDVRSIAQDPSGRLWLAVHGRGLDVYDPARRRVVASHGASVGDSIPHISDWPFQVAVAPDSAVWIASPSGLQVIKGSDKHRFQHRTDRAGSLSSDNVTCLLWDSRGQLWVGTSEGLNLFNAQDSTFRPFTLQQGLNDNYISSLVEDASGDLWIGTYDGLARLSHTSSPEQASIRQIELPQGQYSNQFVERASAVDASGALYFATTHGILSFHPQDLSPGGSLSDVFLTDFQVFTPSSPEGQEPVAKRRGGRTINTLDQVSLEADENTVSVSFAAIDFAHTGPLQYHYQLRGYDQKWLTSSQRSVTYHDLPAGQYEFVVKASVKNLSSVSSVKRLAIHIRKAWYETWWGQALIGFVVLALVVLGLYVVLERIRLKSQAQLSEKEREMDRIKLRFFTNVSHELRTPLVLLMGPLQRLIQGVDAQQASRYLVLMQRYTQRLYRLVDQLLDMRQLEEERYRLRVREGKLASFTEDVYASFEYLAHQQEIAYGFEDQTRQGGQGWFDADVLEKVLYNLLHNAFKYTPGEGQVAVVVSDDPSQKGWVSITVSDTGVGMEAEQLAKIFNRFYRVEQTAHRGGTGIGLSLCQELVALHRGQLRVTSTPGRGSCFTVSLPTQVEAYPPAAAADLREKHQASDELPPSPRPPALPAQEDQHSIVPALSHDTDNKPLILVVDDNVDLLSFLRESMAEDFTIITAQNGQEGFQRAVATVPDAVVSDVMMPIMDGLQLVRQLKKDMRTSHLPVVLLTARASEAYQVEGLRGGADDYLTKPFSVEVLVAQLHSLMSNRTRLKELFSGDQLGSQSRIQESSERTFLFKLTGVIDENLGNESLGTDKICQELGMSRSQLYRKLSAVTGNSVHEFIKLYRLARAVDLLSTDHYTVKEIANRTGFKHPQSFARSFKGHYGCSPTQYVERNVVSKGFDHS